MARHDVKRTRSRYPWTSLGVSFGAAVGLIVGLLFGGGAGIALGMSFGAGIGVAFGAALDHFSSGGPEGS